MNRYTPSLLLTFCSVGLLLFGSACVTDKGAAAAKDVVNLPPDTPPADAILIAKCTSVGNQFYNDFNGAGGEVRNATDAEKSLLEKAQKKCCTQPTRSQVEAAMGADGAAKMKFLCDELPEKMQQAVDAYYDGDYETVFEILAEYPEQLGMFLEFLSVGDIRKSDATAISVESISTTTFSGHQ